MMNSLGMNTSPCRFWSQHYFSPKETRVVCRGRLIASLKRKCSIGLENLVILKARKLSKLLKGLRKKLEEAPIGQIKN